MPVHLPTRRSSPHGDAHWDGPRAVAMVAGVAGLVSFAYATWHLPQVLVLPVFSSLAGVAAAALALLAWCRPGDQHPDHVTYWDLAGTAVLIGVAAALFSDPQQVLPLLTADTP